MPNPVSNVPYALWKLRDPVEACPDQSCDQPGMWFMLPADVLWLHTASPAD